MDPPPLLAAMRALKAALDRFDDDMAGRLGIGRSDLLALRFLAENGAATPGAIQAELGLTSGSVTALIDRLESAGYAQRRPHESDRRSLVVEASASGAAALARASGPLTDLATRLAVRLGRERSEAVVRQLGDLCRMVEFAGQSSTRTPPVR